MEIRGGVIGLADGYRRQGAPEGSDFEKVIETGLSQVVSCVATVKCGESPAPNTRGYLPADHSTAVKPGGQCATTLRVQFGGSLPPGMVLISGWRHASVTDATLVPAAGTEERIAWIAIGT